MNDLLKQKPKKNMEIIDVVKKLIGEIKPVGESNIDTERFRNLKVMCDLTEQLIHEIDQVGCDFKESRQYSMKRSSDYAQTFLTEIAGIK